MWYFLTLHFGLRGRDEHYTMQIEDFALKVDEEGNEYYTFTETATKTRQGGLRKKERVVKLGVNYINNIMKTMVKNTPALEDSNKRLTNHTARKTLVKKLKKSHVTRSEIIAITGHSRETGLDPYDGGDEVEQRYHSNILDNVAVPSNATAVVQKADDTFKPKAVQFLLRRRMGQIRGMRH